MFHGASDEAAAAGDHESSGNPESPLPDSNGRLVLLGRSLIADGGSFTLMSGYVLDDPIPEATSFAVANGGVERFVRAAALSLPRDVRINAVSPGLAADSYQQFGRFNPGRLPVPMGTIASAFLRSVEGWRTGEIIRAR